MWCVYILNGPNLNMLGRREPSIYGTETMEQVLLALQRQYADIHFVYYQSNHEGDLIDRIQEWTLPTEEKLPTDETQEEVCGVVLNAGGYTHTSVALRDAVTMAQIPVVEVHISDITQREAFRRTSLLTDVCAHTIMGIGTRCYQAATEWLLQQGNNRGRTGK